MEDRVRFETEILGNKMNTHFETVLRKTIGIFFLLLILVGVIGCIFAYQFYIAEMESRHSETEEKLLEAERKLDKLQQIIDNNGQNLRP